MKKTFLFAFIFITVQFAVAQTGDLLIKSSDKGLYLEHMVMAKENFYSLARLYYVHPKEIAAYNKMDMSKGLSLGQTLRIPLTTANFSQTGNEGTPVYYKVGEKEGLIKVSNAVNKVPLKNLRNWNNLNSDNMDARSKLIVGFLRVPGTIPEVINEKKEFIVSETIKPEIAEPKKEEKLVKTEPVIEKPSQQSKLVVTDQGYFKSSYDKQIRIHPVSKNETVTSGIFKTSSGWKDFKYYLLIDGIQPGIIVKLINPGNNKSVYAKVLGEMSGIRQNEGLNIRISNAAASALQVTEQDKFIMKVNY